MRKRFASIALAFMSVAGCRDAIEPNAGATGPKASTAVVSAALGPLTTNLVVVPSASSLKMEAFANAVSNDVNAGSTVTDVKSAAQTSTTSPLSVFVQAQSASGEASVVATGSANASWSSPAEGQVQWAVDWSIQNVGAPGALAHIHAIAADEGWRYTFTPDRDGVFILDYSITADFTIGINGFNFLWPDEFNSTFLVPNTTGRVTRPVTAGTQSSVALTNNSGVTSNIFGGCCSSGPDASMTATFHWSIVPALPVDIDIKPGGSPNSINPNNRGTIPVAILSTADFDAPAQVDPTSLTFGRTGVEPSLAFCSQTEDVNGDGRLDLVCHFYTQLTGFRPGDTEGLLQGQTVNGTPIEGTDDISVIH